VKYDWTENEVLRPLRLSYPFVRWDNDSAAKDYGLTATEIVHAAVILPIQPLGSGKGIYASNWMMDLRSLSPAPFNSNAHPMGNLQLRLVHRHFSFLPLLDHGKCSQNHMPYLHTSRQRRSLQTPQRVDFVLWVVHGCFSLTTTIVLYAAFTCFGALGERLREQHG
jgi:hypothetical protein